MDQLITYFQTLITFVFICFTVTHWIVANFNLCQEWILLVHFHVNKRTFFKDPTSLGRHLRPAFN